MAAAPQKSEKERIFEAWDKPAVLDPYSPYNSLLTGLKEQNDELYKIGCSLTENYKNAHIMQTNNPNICKLLNEWLNKKKNIHIKSEEDFENKKLWNDYIEKLWIELEKDNYRYYWCRRNFPSSYIANALATSFTILYTTIRSWLDIFINKKITLKQNLYDDISNGLVETFSEYSDSQAPNNSINLSYSS
ncbi:PIR Superfamily Protein [Plasmodium ovale curtisi]|uniref:PIR Superfamily Protein n=1 Tax=Plasmodium ovale curtisi TaxID=864141 RepID=A0A1A8WP93_PLAOA|nr:PIR Superfamily Protein [Plasmodium ovale curtisi]